MQVDFQRTLRSLTDERQGSGFGCLAMLVIGAAVTGWSLWLFLARVPIYEVSATARVESGRRGHPVESVVAARVVRVAARLGEPVRAGDLLAVLDDTAIRQRIEGLNREFAAISAQAQTRRAEVGLMEQLVASRRAALDVTVGQALARHEQANAAAAYADFAVSQQGKLLEKGVTTRTAYIQAQRDAQGKRAEERSAALEADRLRAQLKLEEQETLIRLSDLRSRIAELDAALARNEAELSTLRKQREDHQIRAASDGLVAELSDVQPGSYVQTGTRLATIVPEGSLRVVAEFAPATAIGRVAVGQVAQLRLAGFPAAQYGTLAATVDNVAGEMRNGTIRVELALSPEARSVIPLQHGQPGTVEVAVGQSAPFDLVVRSAVRLVRPGEAGQPGMGQPGAGPVRTAAAGGTGA